MTHHIIDTDELEKLITTNGLDGVKYVEINTLRALIASSPQADGMANSRDMFEQFATLHNMPVLKVGEAYSNDDTNYAWWVWQKALLNTPQTNDIVQSLINELETMAKSYDNTPNIHSAISLLKSKLSAYKPQADDVRKDAERYRWLREKSIEHKDPSPSATMSDGFGIKVKWGLWGDVSCQHYVDLHGTDLDQAIDKARE